MRGPACSCWAALTASSLPALLRALGRAHHRADGRQGRAAAAGGRGGVRHAVGRRRAGGGSRGRGGRCGARGEEQAGAEEGGGRRR